MTQVASEETIGAGEKQETVLHLTVTRCHEALDTTRNWIVPFGDPNGPLVQIEGVQKGSSILITVAQAKLLASRLKEVCSAPVKPLTPEKVREMAERAFKPLESTKPKKKG